MLESTLEKRFVARCHERGLLTFKFNSASRRGVPDRIILGKGKTMFLEFKKKGEHPTKLQQFYLQLIRDEGMVAEWVDTYEKAEAILKRTFG